MSVETQQKINANKTPQAQPPQPGKRSQSIQPTKTDATAAVRSAAAQEVNQPLSLSVCQFLADMGFKIVLDIDGKSQSLPEFVKTVCAKFIKEIDPNKRNDPAYLIRFALSRTQNPKLIAQLNAKLDENTRNKWRMVAPQLQTISLSQLVNSDPPKPQMPATNKAERPAASQAEKILTGQPNYSEMPEISSLVIPSLAGFFELCGDSKCGGLTPELTTLAVMEINTVGVA